VYFFVWQIWNIFRKNGTLCVTHRPIVWWYCTVPYFWSNTICFIKSHYIHSVNINICSLYLLEYQKWPTNRKHFVWFSARRVNFSYMGLSFHEWRTTRPVFTTQFFWVSTSDTYTRWVKCNKTLSHRNTIWKMRHKVSLPHGNLNMKMVH